MLLLSEPRGTSNTVVKLWAANAELLDATSQVRGVAREPGGTVEVWAAFWGIFLF